MSMAVETGVGPMDIRALHERMGRVYHQPVRVHSFTNKRFTVNFRVPLDQLRRIVPEPVQLDEIRDTGRLDRPPHSQPSCGSHRAGDSHC